MAHVHPPKTAPLQTPLPELGLSGEHQYNNAALALAGFRYIITARSIAFDKAAPPKGIDLSKVIASPIDRDAERKGLAKAHIAGRMQRISTLPAQQLHHDFGPQGLPPMLFDGAHNPHGMAALGLSLAKRGIAPLATVFSCLADKDVDALITHLRTMSLGAIFVPPIENNPRAIPPTELAAHIGLNAIACQSVHEAMACASLHMHERMPEVFTKNDSSHPLLVCGSFYLLGHVFSLLPAFLLEEPA